MVVPNERVSMVVERFMKIKVPPKKLYLQVVYDQKQSSNLGHKETKAEGMS